MGEHEERRASHLQLLGAVGAVGMFVTLRKRSVLGHRDPYSTTPKFVHTYDGTVNWRAFITPFEIETEPSGWSDREASLAPLESLWGYDGGCVTDSVRFDFVKRGLSGPEKISCDLLRRIDYPARQCTRSLLTAAARGGE